MNGIGAEGQDIVAQRLTYSLKKTAAMIACVKSTGDSQEPGVSEYWRLAAECREPRFEHVRLDPTTELNQAR